MDSEGLHSAIEQVYLTYTNYDFYNNEIFIKPYIFSVYCYEKQISQWPIVAPAENVLCQIHCGLITMIKGSTETEILLQVKMTMCTWRIIHWCVCPINLRGDDMQPKCSCVHLPLCSQGFSNWMFSHSDHTHTTVHFNPQISMETIFKNEKTIKLKLTV